MKHARWRHGAVIIAIVAAIAAVFFLVKVPAHDRGGDEGGDGASAVADEGAVVDSSSSAGTAAVAHSSSPAQPGTRVPPIPEGLPPVDPVDPPEYATGLPVDTLYAPNPQAKAHFADKLPFGVDDRSYVEFNRSALRALQVGSELTLRTPDDGKQHTVRIDEVQVHPNGDKSWLGHVLDAGGEVLPVVFTQGVDSSFGNISTRSGTYSLEAEGRLGWIANVNTLRRHQDFDTPDVMIPDPGNAKAPPGQL